MANPQPDIFIKVSREYFNALMKIRISGEQRQVLDAIISKTWGYNKKTDMISNSQFCKATGMGKTAVCRAVNSLIKKNLVIKNDNTHIPTYSIQKDFDKWKSLPKKVTVIKNDKAVIKKDTDLLSKKIPTIDNIQKKLLQKKLYSRNSDEFRLSYLLFDLILQRNDNHKKPNLQSWAKHIDYMLRLDKRDPNIIENVIVWCQADSFWCGNILSTSKLREQFDKLKIKMEAQNDGQAHNRKTQEPNFSDGQPYPVDDIITPDDPSL